MEEAESNSTFKKQGSTHAFASCGGGWLEGAGEGQEVDAGILIFLL